MRGNQPLNEVGESEYQKDEVQNDQTNTVAQVQTEETFRLNGKLQLVDGSFVSSEELEIIEKMEEILKRDRIRLQSLKGIERKWL